MQCNMSLKLLFTSNDVTVKKDSEVCLIKLKRVRYSVIYCIPKMKDISIIYILSRLLITSLKVGGLDVPFEKLPHEFEKGNTFYRV